MISLPDLNEASSVIDLARWQVQHNPDQIAFTFLPDGEDEAYDLTYRELDLRARALAAALQKYGKPGERALLLYPSGLDAIVGLFGCIYAGMVCTWTNLPRPDSSLEPIRAIAATSGATLALTSSAYLALIRDRTQQSGLQSLCWLATDELEQAANPDDWQPPHLTRDSLMALMFTSGSTSIPKGVMVTQGGILNELEYTRQYFRVSNDMVFVTWSPMYHIGGLLSPFRIFGYSARLVFMPPQAFLERPIRWLKAITRYRSYAGASFNFGLSICMSRTTEEERTGLDLSSLEILTIGGEQIQVGLVEEFVRIFSKYGLKRRAIRFIYGLTETYGSGSVSRDRPEGFQAYFLDQKELALNKLVLGDPATDKGRFHAGCGNEYADKRVVIVDPLTRKPCLPGETGEIWISDQNMTKGYWDRPEQTRETFEGYLADTDEGPFLRTGDIGGLIDDNLVITGRMKEMIILHGKNYFSQDLEKTVESVHPALTPGSIAAFAIEAGDQERLAVLCEVKAEVSDIQADEIIHAVRLAIARDQQQAVYLVGLVKTGSLPRSTSGKLLRFACRESLLSAQLDMIKLSRLEDPEAAPVESVSKYAAPRSAIERALVGIWSSVLGKARIGINDNFFDLGGDSLLGAQVLSQVQDVFQVELPTHLVFKTTTIAGMAALIVELRDKPNS